MAPILQHLFGKNCICVISSITILNFLHVYIKVSVSISCGLSHVPIRPFTCIDMLVLYWVTWNQALNKQTPTNPGETSCSRVTQNLRRRFRVQENRPDSPSGGGHNFQNKQRVGGGGDPGKQCVSRPHIKKPCKSRSPEERRVLPSGGQRARQSCDDSSESSST